MEIVKRVWREEGYLKEWRRGMIYLIHKKEEVDKEENYRGITLLNLAAKIYAVVLTERLRKAVEGKKLLSETSGI